MIKKLEIAEAKVRFSSMVIKCRIRTFLISDEKDELEKLFQNVDYSVFSAILEANLKTRNNYLIGWCGYIHLLIFLKTNEPIFNIFFTITSEDH